MSYDAMTCHVWIIPENIIQEKAPNEYKAFHEYAERFATDLAMFAHGLEDDEQISFDSMDFSHEDFEDESHPVGCGELTEDEYQDKCFDHLKELHKAVCTAFYEATGIDVALWAMLGDIASQYNVIDTETAMWISTIIPVEMKPEFKAIGLNEMDDSFRPFVVYG